MRKLRLIVAWWLGWGDRLRGRAGSTTSDSLSIVFTPCCLFFSKILAVSRVLGNYVLSAGNSHLPPGLAPGSLPPRENRNKGTGPYPGPPQPGEMGESGGSESKYPESGLPATWAMAEAACPRTAEVWSFLHELSTQYPRVPLSMVFSLVSVGKGLSGILHCCLA